MRTPKKLEDDYRELDLKPGATLEEVRDSYKGKKLKDVYPWGTQWPPPKGAGNYEAKFVRNNNNCAQNAIRGIMKS